MSIKRRANKSKAKTARKSITLSRKGRKNKRSVAKPAKKSQTPKQKIITRTDSKSEKVLAQLASEVKKISSSVELLKSEQKEDLVEITQAIKTLASKANSKNQEKLADNASIRSVATPTEDSHAKPQTELLKSQHEQERLKKEELSAKSRITNLNAELTELQKKVDALHKYYIAQNQSLEGELDARRKSIHQRVEDERTQAESEIMGLLRQRDSVRNELRDLTDAKTNIGKEIEFAKSLSSLMRNPDAISEAELAVLSDRFEQARIARSKGSKSLSDAQARAARQNLTSAIEKIRNP